MFLDHSIERAEETDDLQVFAVKALRRNQPGSYEHLLCQYLIRSVEAGIIVEAAKRIRATRPYPNGFLVEEVKA